MKLTSFHLLLFLLLFCTSARCQEGYKFNYNIESGLPSNHIYAMLTDKLGYIWLCTPAGYARYNGYEFKLFNTSDGMPTDDTWGIIEDDKGKIWPISISDDMGYIYNNKYHSIKIINGNHTIYPKSFQKTPDGLIFTTYNYKNKENRTRVNLLAIAHDDTLHQYHIDSIKFSHNSSSEERILCSPAITLKKDSLFLNNNNIYRFHIANSIVSTKLIANFGISTRADMLKAANGMVFDNKLVLVPENNIISWYDLLTGKKYTSKIEEIEEMHGTFPYFWSQHQRDFLYGVSKNSMFKFIFSDSSLKLVSKTNLTSLIADSTIDGSKISGANENKFWGICLGSNTNGLNIYKNTRKHFFPEKKIDLKNFTRIGGRRGIVSLWWNSNSTLAVIDSNCNITYHKYPRMLWLNTLSHYKNDSFLLIAHKVYWVTAGNGKLKEDTTLFNLNDGKRMFFHDSANFTMVASQGMYNSNLHSKFQSRKTLDPEKYTDLTYDSTRQVLWAYNQHRVFIHGNKKNILLRKEQLTAAGIQKIDKIVIDGTYGNVFILQNGASGYELRMYNYEQNTCTSLLSNFNLKKSHILVYKRKLILSGEYGTLFCNILGKNKVSAPLTYWNVKNFHFNEVIGMDVLKNTVLINTDKGTFSTTMPDDSDFNHIDSTANINYNLVLYYKDTVFKVTKNDTLRLNQKNLNLQFDVVNPSGIGKVHYSYHLQGDSAWHKLNANELTLPQGLIPGKHYTLSIRVDDDIWRSDTASISIAIIPYWWQLLFQNPLFWAFIILIVLLLLLLLVLVTKRIVNSNNLKRNLRQEIELKSVHSQINPHFIFNTLNTAQYFIKKGKIEEAYDHVSKFSKLLRAFIKSSRNKFITIDDEVTNLNNYIQLQQSRFEDKFDYEIIVDTRIDSTKMQIPALLLQPIVENAIDHGLFHKTGHGHLKIEFKKISLSNEIQCVVDDDGIGRKRSKNIELASIIKTESYGESLIEDLVSIFNKYEKTGISIEYIDKQLPQTGTTVVINIKNPTYEK